MMLINFYDDEMLQTGKEILNTVIQADTAKYMKNFYDVSFDDRPDTPFGSTGTRYNRRVLVYKLVIVDQSIGEPEFNETVAKRVMWKIFRKNQEIFREGTPPPDILVYVEKAHNLLPAGNDLDLKDVWVRTAKEGARSRRSARTSRCRAAICPKTRR
jgi:hypothetical protein